MQNLNTHLPGVKFQWRLPKRIPHKETYFQNLKASCLLSLMYKLLEKRKSLEGRIGLRCSANLQGVQTSSIPVLPCNFTAIRGAPATQAHAWEIPRWRPAFNSHKTFRASGSGQEMWDVNSEAHQTLVCKSTQREEVYTLGYDGGVCMWKVHGNAVCVCVGCGGCAW